MAGLIADGVVSQNDLETISLIALMLGWDKTWSLEDLPFAGAPETVSDDALVPEVDSRRDTHVTPRMTPELPTLVARPSSTKRKGKGKARASAPRPQPVVLLGEDFLLYFIRSFSIN